MNTSAGIKKTSVLGVCLLFALFAGCVSSKDDTSSFDKSSDEKIVALCREDGSGTRNAFSELFELIEEKQDGRKEDRTSPHAAVSNSTAVMLTSVANDPAAISYVSMGSLNDTIKALRIDGILADPEHVKDGSYRFSRPFNLVVRDQLSLPAEDFMAFILSDDGQRVIEENDCISVGRQADYQPASVLGKVVVSGSSSVTPVMTKLAEAYQAIQPDVEVEIQQNDSSTGISDAISGVADLGMSSRALKENEWSEGVSSITIAMDGIAVIVHPSNPADNLSSEDIYSIYSGEISRWSDLSAFESSVSKSGDSDN